MERIIIFGAGKHLNTVKKIIGEAKAFEVVEIWDNSSDKWGHSYSINDRTVSILKPHYVRDIPIVICSPIYEKEIKKQLIEEVGIDLGSIKNSNYLFHRYKEDIIRIYGDSKDDEIKEIIEYLKDNELRIYNYSFFDSYKDKDIKLYYDDICQLYYTNWKGHRMYLSCDLGNEGNIREYVRGILAEQDESSPHCYTCFPIETNDEDVIVDAGGAEGFFTLERIENVKKAYIIESDPHWIKALEYTFKPYKEKVEIINKLLGDKANDRSVTIDDINRRDRVTLIKMDIEGYEYAALEGAKQTLKNDNLRIIVCTYHNSGDEEQIGGMLEKAGYKIWFSHGYMFFAYGEAINAELRRGLIFANRN